MAALLCGTGPCSIAVYLGHWLADSGWNTFLYSRTAKRQDAEALHIRSADIMKPTSLCALLDEAQGHDNGPDLVVVSADAGGAFGTLDTLSPVDIQKFLDVKVYGSVSMVQELLKRGRRTKIIFLCGRNGPKPKDCLLYGMVNAAIMSLVDAINTHHHDTLAAYYLETPVILRSTITMEYRAITGHEPEGWEMSDLQHQVGLIVDDIAKPGFVPFPEKEGVL